jgi:hypothetical protein
MIKIYKNVILSVWMIFHFKDKTYVEILWDRSAQTDIWTLEKKEIMIFILRIYTL